MDHNHCETLLLPIPGDSPAGDAAHFAMTLAPVLRELRREESPDEFTDATRPTVLKKADWAEIARLCAQALCEKAKDLRTACHLAYAWMRLEGLAGLADGLELLALLVESCWDRITPPEGDDAGESRGAPVANLLDDPDRGVCFPSHIRTLPLVGSPDAARSFNEWTQLRSERSKEDSDRLAQLRQQATPECLTAQHADALRAIASLDLLRKGFDERLGESAPALLNLRAAISDISGLLVDELKRRGVEANATVAADAGSAEANSSVRIGGGDPAREQLYALLDKTAERLRSMEPHSPVPYLIKRAVRLGRLPFPLLMEQVIREPSALTELNREFGIAESDGPAVLT